MDYNFNERLHQLFPDYEYKDDLSPYQMVMKNESLWIPYWKEINLLNDEYCNTPQPTLSTLWLSRLVFSYGYMMGKRDTRQDIIKKGEKVNPIYSGQNQWLKELTTIPFTENLNYIRVIRSIPKYFETNDIYMCMMLAFNFGNARGQECERDMIKWNVSATFRWMKIYYEENGCFPDTEDDLWKWEKEFVNELETKEGVVNA